MKIKKIIKTLLIVLVLMISLVFVSWMIKGEVIDSKINDFIKRGELIYKDNNKEYYLVKTKYNYENPSNVLNNQFIGTTGDIYLCNRNPVKESIIVEQLSKIVWIGHGAIVSENDGSKTVEITGNESKKDNKVKEKHNTWLGDTLFSDMMVLRVKGMDEEKQQKIKNYCLNALGKSYNYLFLFHNKDKYYCTDLISQCYNSLNISLDFDSLATTGADICINNKVYLIYYKRNVYVNNKRIEKIYYLGE